MMDLYLQFGHGMMGHCRHLISKWGEGTVILSPRDLKEEQLKKFSQELKDINGSTLFDPQYYDPRANHKKLTGHTHWLDNFDTGLLSDLAYMRRHFEEIKTINNYTHTEAYIIPSVMCDSVDKIWTDIQEVFLDVSSEIFVDKDRYATIALKKDVLQDEASIQKIIDMSEIWDVDGYYIVPEGTYLIEDSDWLSNLALLVAGLKFQNRKVIVGYSSHQMLYLACVKVDAIASGTFLNVRSFNAGKFVEKDDDSISRRTTWYYCPQALSEYKLRALDAAKKEGVLDELKPYGRTNEYIDTLFSAPKPSTSGFSETLAFKHYLSELKLQCLLSTKSTFEETLDFHKQINEDSLTFLHKMKRYGVRDTGRCYETIADYNFDAIRTIERELGGLLKRRW